VCGTVWCTHSAQNALGSRVGTCPIHGRTGSFENMRWFFRGRLRTNSITSWGHTFGTCACHACLVWLYKKTGKQITENSHGRLSSKYVSVLCDIALFFTCLFAIRTRVVRYLSVRFEFRLGNFPSTFKLKLNLKVTCRPLRPENARDLEAIVLGASQFKAAVVSVWLTWGWHTESMHHYWMIIHLLSSVSVA